MKKTVFMIPALLLVCVCAYGQAQDKDAAKQEYEIAKQKMKDYDRLGLVWSYDRFRDETTLRTKGQGVQTIPISITISVAVVYKGQAPPDIKTPLILVTNIFASRWQQLESDRQVRMLIDDGDPIALGTASYASRVGQRGEALTTEMLTVPIKLSDVIRMTGAKYARVQIGRTEFVIKDKHLKSLQPLVDLMAPSTPKQSEGVK